jgi:hypothetical protein
MSAGLKARRAAGRLSLVAAVRMHLGALGQRSSLAKVWTSRRHRRYSSASRGRGGRTGSGPPAAFAGRPALPVLPLVICA